MGNRRRIVFSISQHETEMQILEALKSHFGCGYIICNGKNRKVYEYRIFGAKSGAKSIISKCATRTLFSINFVLKLGRAKRGIIQIFEK